MGLENNGSVPYEIQPNAPFSSPPPQQAPSFSDAVLSAAQLVDFLKTTDQAGKADGIITPEDYSAEYAAIVAAQPKPDGTMREGREFIDEMESQKLNLAVKQMGSSVFQVNKVGAEIYGPRISFTIEEAAANNVKLISERFPDEMKKLNAEADLTASKPTEVLAKMAEVLREKQQQEGIEK